MLFLSNIKGSKSEYLIFGNYSKMLPLDTKNKVAQKLVNRLSLPTCFMCIIYWLSILIFFPDQYMRMIPPLVPFALSLIAWISVRNGHEIFGGNLLAGAMVGNIILSMIISGGIKAPGFIGTFAFIIVVGSLYGYKRAFFIGVGLILTGLFCIKLISLGLLRPYSEPSISYLAFNYLIYFIVTIIFISAPIELIEEALQDTQNALVKEANAKSELDAILNRTPDIIFKLDTLGNITFINKAVTNYGYNTSSMFGKNIIDFIAPDDKENFQKQLFEKIEQIKETKIERTAENKIKTKILIKSQVENINAKSNDKLENTTLSSLFSKIFLVSISAIYIDNANPEKGCIGVQGVARDITIEQQMIQAQKMQAIGTLAGGIAHDFNNILSGILGYSQLIQDDLEENESSLVNKDRIDRVIQASLRAKELVSQILTFSRSGHDQTPYPIQVKLIAKEVLVFIRASLPSFIKIEQQIFSESYITASPINIHQIIMNLCTNAKDAIGDNAGTLTLTLKDQYLSQGDVEKYSGVASGNFLLISVKDTGQGIEKYLLERIFEPFFTTKPKGKGTGIGLSVIHGIVSSLHGFIDVESAYGQGSEFKVFLPIYHYNHKTSQTSALSFENKEDKKLYSGIEKILFVDDEIMLTEMVKDSLEKYGYDVTIFSNTLDALEYFKQTYQKYNMVISDITMAEMPGDIFVEQIRLISPDIPVILCTGFSNRINSTKAELLRVNAIIYKPMLIEEMLFKIRRIFDGAGDGKYLNY